MISFGIENLRRLVTVAPVEIRPITLLVGRNSSGKSSFLRAFPLVRQSLMTRTSSPILWYGDFVDFGSFEGAVTDNDVQKAIKFTFGVDKISVPVPNRWGYFSSESSRQFAAKLEVSISLTSDSPTIVSTNERTQISALKLFLNEDEMCFSMRLNAQNEISELTLNGDDILGFFSEFRIILSQGTIFPDILLRAIKPPSPGSYYTHEGGYLLDAIGKVLSPHLNRRIKSDTLNSYAISLLSISDFNKESLLALSNHISAAQSFKRLLADIGDKDSKSLFLPLQRIHRANMFASILSRLTQQLRETISSTLYIGPARARSERYYRYQDLSVSEIDSDGTNFPMFLSSLSARQLSNLSDWVERLFNYRIEIKASVGHLSINLIEGEHSTNIVDTGYGVSQILPVLGQIWWAANRAKSQQSVARPSRRATERSSLLAIEQPELHLHPAHQALLADAIVAQSASDENSEPLYFLIETHSETLVNRLGELISQGSLDAQAVQILVFEPSAMDDRVTEVNIATFGAEGQLINWPYGFFQPSR